MAQGQQVLSTTFSGIVVILMTLPLLFYDTTSSMVNVWISNETFTHGFLILPISLWLIWRKKNQINQLLAKPEPRLLILLIPILSIWLVSKIVEVQVVQQLTVVILIPIVVWLLYGRDILLTLLFPLLYLFFAVPLGQSLIPPMMEFTAYFTVYLINLTAIPVYQDGLYFTLPSGSWSVVEECSGVRYLIASLALGTIYAYTSYSLVHKRLIFICFSIIIPILANGLRAFLIVMIGHHSGMELAVGADHLLYGWVFFGIIIFLMFYIGSFWWDPEQKTEQVGGTTPKAEANYSNNRIILLGVIALFIMLSVNVVAYKISHEDYPVPNISVLSFPGNFEPWQLDQNTSVEWEPEFRNPDLTVSHSYRWETNIVQLNIGYYAYQRKNAETISGQNRLTNPYGGDWKITSTRTLKIGGRQVKETGIRRLNHKILVWSWYQVGKFQTPNTYVAKLYEAYNKFFEGREDAALISIAAALNNQNSETVRNSLLNFWQSAGDEISHRLEQLYRVHTQSHRLDE